MPRPPQVAVNRLVGDIQPFPSGKAGELEPDPIPRKLGTALPIVQKMGPDLPCIRVFPYRLPLHFPVPSAHSQNFHKQKMLHFVTEYLIKSVVVKSRQIIANGGKYIFVYY
jgi:hypothetical protein